VVHKELWGLWHWLTNSQMENQIVVNDYRQMDKILKEERTYLLTMCKKIKRAKCNVLFIQKSILRDAVNDLSLHFLAKLNILAIKDIERDEVEFICKVRLPLLLPRLGYIF
jgi:T-complex protein 1 subunit delta